MFGVHRPSKQDLKYQKMLSKQIEDLHKGQQNMNRRGEDRGAQSDPQDGYIDRKGKKWWQRFDQRHFKSLSSREYHQLRELTTSDQILQQSPRQSLPTLSYAQYKIINEYDLFTDKNLVHVLFKSKAPKYRCISSFCLEPNANNSTPPPQQTQTTAYRVASNLKVQAEEKALLSEMGTLTLAGYNQDQEVCRSIDHYNRTINKHPQKNQLQLQILLFEKELAAVSKDNQYCWEKLIKKIKKDRPLLEDQKQIDTIRTELMWSTVLKYFEHGFGDKTNQQLQQLLDTQKMLKPIKSKTTANNNKFFETDCKICFCSFNNDSNQVLYCDQCDTSFHLACYGLQELPKADPYYCDYCTATRAGNKNLKCQLCSKTKFPMKEIEGHYYHVTCLMMFNLVDIQKGTLAFRKDVSHGKILQMIVDSQLTLRQCQFCVGGALMGIRMKCAFAGCQNSAHPICAYINGCKFWVRRDSVNKKLNISYHCNIHNQSRDWVEQTYLRRYMCNFRKTSVLKQSAFRLHYQQQVSKRQTTPKSRYSWDKSKIIHRTKFIAKRMAQLQQKQSNQAEVQTETMKMLERLKRKK